MKNSNFNLLILVAFIVFGLMSQGCTRNNDPKNNANTNPSFEVPAGFISHVGKGQLVIGWRTVSDATSYNIYYSQSSTISKTTGTKIANVSMPYIHTGLTNGTTYSYFVSVVKSNGATVESTSFSSIPSSTGNVPDAPLATSVPGNGQITLRWNSGYNSTTFNIYWSTAPGVSKNTGIKISQVSSPYTHTGLNNGTSYYYVVTAVNSYGESADSVQVAESPFATGIAPSLPAGVIANPGSKENEIRWDATARATSYNVYWSAVPGVNTVSGNRVSTAFHSFAHQNLTDGTTYYYRITAVNNYGESSPSSEVSATPYQASYGVIPQIPVCNCVGFPPSPWAYGGSTAPEPPACHECRMKIKWGDYCSQIEASKCWVDNNCVSLYGVSGGVDYALYNCGLLQGMIPCPSVGESLICTVTSGSFPPEPDGYTPGATFPYQGDLNLYATFNPPCLEFNIGITIDSSGNISSPYNPTFTFIGNVSDTGEISFSMYYDGTNKQNTWFGQLTGSGDDLVGNGTVIWYWTDYDNSPKTCSGTWTGLVENF